MGPSVPLDSYLSRQPEPLSRIKLPKLSFNDVVDSQNLDLQKQQHSVCFAQELSGDKENVDTQRNNEDELLESGDLTAFNE